MYKTLLTPGTHEMIVEKSRFITHVIPISSQAQAEAFIDQIKKQHWKANHNVPIAVLGEKYHYQKCSDDGEPSGTAGMPVLDFLKHENITNVCVVITRYFGGIKLGTGGLVRAYTQAAKLAFTNDLLATVDSYVKVSCQFDYTYQGKIMHLLGSHPAFITKQDFSHLVDIDFYINPKDHAIIKEALIELTGNNITLNEEDVFGTIVNHSFIPMEAVDESNH